MVRARPTYERGRSPGEPFARWAPHAALRPSGPRRRRRAPGLATGRSWRAAEKLAHGSHPARAAILPAIHRLVVAAGADDRASVEPRPCRYSQAVRVGTAWEPLALRTARSGSRLLTCASLHLRKRISMRVRVTCMHSWGSRGRGFKSRRPDGFSNICRIRIGRFRSQWDRDWLDHSRLARNSWCR
jgi:hypothetical protein